MSDSGNGVVRPASKAEDFSRTHEEELSDQLTGMKLVGTLQPGTTGHLDSSALQADMSVLNIDNYPATSSPATRSKVSIESTHTAASSAQSNQTQVPHASAAGHCTLPSVPEQENAGDIMTAGHHKGKDVGAAEGGINARKPSKSRLPPAAARPAARPVLPTAGRGGNPRQNLMPLHPTALGATTPYPFLPPASKRGKQMFDSDSDSDE